MCTWVNFIIYNFVKAAAKLAYSLWFSKANLYLTFITWTWILWVYCPWLRRLGIWLTALGSGKKFFLGCFMWHFFQNLIPIQVSFSLTLHFIFHLKKKSWAFKLWFEPKPLASEPNIPSLRYPAIALKQSQRFCQQNVSVSAPWTWPWCCRTWHHRPVSCGLGYPGASWGNCPTMRVWTFHCPSSLSYLVYRWVLLLTDC